MIPFDHVIGLSALLFGLGALGVLVRRNLIVMLLSIELMLNGANLALVAFNRLWPGGETAATFDGQVFALLVTAVAAAQAVVGVGIVLAWLRNRDSVDPEAVSLLKW